MAKFVGVKVSNQMWTGLVVDHKLVDELHRFQIGRASCRERV